MRLVTYEVVVNVLRWLAVVIVVFHEEVRGYLSSVNYYIDCTEIQLRHYSKFLPIFQFILFAMLHDYCLSLRDLKKKRHSKKQFCAGFAFIFLETRVPNGELYLVKSSSLFCNLQICNSCVTISLYLGCFQSICKKKIFEIV